MDDSSYLMTLWDWLTNFHGYHVNFDDFIVLIYG